MAGTHIKNREAEVVIFRRRALLAGMLQALTEALDRGIIGR